MGQKILRTIKRLFFPLAIIFIATTFTGAYFSDSVAITNNSFTVGEPEPELGRVVISEVFYYNPANIANNQWVELYNAGGSAVDIKGWVICDNANHCGTLNPAKKTEIAPGGYVVIAHSASDLKSRTIPITAEIIYYAGPKIVFNNSAGDAVILKNDSEVIIDQMSYGGDISAFNPSCPAVASGHSLARNPAGNDTNSASDFIDLALPTPGI